MPAKKSIRGRGCPRTDAELLLPFTFSSPRFGESSKENRAFFDPDALQKVEYFAADAMYLDASVFGVLDDGQMNGANCQHTTYSGLLDAIGVDAQERSPPFG